ncbi:MAG TPA: hypothetical protein VNT20_08555 [Flavisolibacter sp.]|jgi:hypothetical protein|nr:hypothetical protein [Flavisolibacter sp.]
MALKTANPVETQLNESGIDTRLNHKNYIGHLTKTTSVKTKKIVRNVDKANMGILSLFGIEDFTTQSKVSVHPEFVAYAFHLYGLSRKLFLYIVFFELNNDTCKFILDKAMMQRFREFCLMFEGGEESDSSIQQAIRSLIRKNTMIALEVGEYMLNPLIAGGTNENKRRKLINGYSKILERKGLDTSVHYYPRYQLTL